MKILHVTSRSDLKRFIDLPYELYKKDPVWVPPLLEDQFRQFDLKRNPMLGHCEYALFLLEENEKIIGRVAAFIDRLALETWKEPIGLFGYYECIEDLTVSNLLLETAATWLRNKGMTKMRGPWSFISHEWGLVLEGFTPSPVVMTPYNPPYYIDHLASFNLEKIKDLLVYYISIKEGYTIPGRIMTLTDDVVRRYGVHVRHVDMKNYDKDVQSFIDLSNRSLINNWGYTSVTREEADAIARDLKPLIQPKGIIFAEDAEGKPIGFVITLPDINRILKSLNGHLFPFGWLKLRLGIPKLRNYRLYALGVIPEYHRKGIDSLLYRALCESLYAPDTWIEINYVLEDNAPMNNAIHKLNAKPLRKYRIFEKEL